MRRCARLTCYTAFARTHRSWCSLVWLFTSGMHLVGGFRRFDVEQLKLPWRLRCGSHRSRRKPEPAAVICEELEWLEDVVAIGSQRDESVGCVGLWPVHPEAAVHAERRPAGPWLQRACLLSSQSAEQKHAQHDKENI